MTFVDPHNFTHDAVDVFMSGSHRDQKIPHLAEKFKSVGLSIFHSGLGVPAGLDYTTYIQHYLRHSKTILVCWCPDSMQSAWVNAEAEYARINNRLAACMTEVCELLPPFNTFQTADLTQWNSEERNNTQYDALQKLLQHRSTGSIKKFSQ
jgi:hypothetical protein